MDNQQQNLNNLIIEKYLSGISANKIAKELNLNVSTIVNRLRKNGIQIRTIKEGVKLSHQKEPIIFSQEFKEILNGLIMGDGCLYIPTNGTTPMYNHTDKNYEAIMYYKNLFEQQGIKTSNVWYREDNGNGRYSFQTECREEFRQHYELFYPIDGKKRLPNIDLTPLTLIHWYIGDGSVKKVGKGTLNNAVLITNKWGNPYILKQIQELFHENSKYYELKLYRNFYIPHKGMQKFLDYIGKCPIECYKYKWITRRCSETIMEES